LFILVLFLDKGGDWVYNGCKLIAVTICLDTKSEGETMQTELRQWKNLDKNSGGNPAWSGATELADAQLVIYFAGKGVLNSGERFGELRSFYPSAHIIGCSTGGEIYGDEVLDGTISAAAISFKYTTLKTASVGVRDVHDSFNAGKQIARELVAPDLVNIFVLSDGINVNGSDLVRGLYEIVGKNIVITGGLAGDAADFRETLVGVDTVPKPNIIAAIGFYGKHLSVSYGSVGGWDAFGPKRIITKSRGSVLYELDGKPALDLYKHYLGADAEKLPSSALLFPLSIHPANDEMNVIVRTVVAVNEREKTMTFAGDVPEGYVAQLMRGDFDNLVEGAAKAAGLAISGKPEYNKVAILVSCFGRKLLLGQRISDETEAIAEMLKYNIPTIGFYSYGEICHQQFTNECGLHNQTMTVTMLYESD
jgi:hypothetical protein